MKNSKNKKKESIWVLDLGCGTSASFFTLRRYFSDQGININYAGVDIQKKLIEENDTICKNHLNAFFYDADASTPDKLKDFFKPDFADLVVCQHPQVLGYGNKAVQSMLTTTLPYYLSPEGRVFISCFDPKEWEVIRNLNVNGCVIFPQDEQKNECRIMLNSGDPEEGSTDAVVYVSSIPLKVKELFTKGKSENAPLASEGKSEKAPLASEGQTEKPPLSSERQSENAPAASDVAPTSRRPR